jgi:hypothetical protein
MFKSNSHNERDYTELLNKFKRKKFSSITEYEIIENNIQNEKTLDNELNFILIENTNNDNKKEKIMKLKFIFYKNY